MKAEQVDRALLQRFVTEDARLVFWHDPRGDFAEYVAAGFTGALEGVQVLDVARCGGLAAKLRLEREDTTGKYLVYSTGEAPAAEEDWLLDIRLYSATFEAEMASLWLQELGLVGLGRREHLTARAVFLGSQERRRKLARWVNPADDEAALDLKMMAVLVGSPLPSVFEVLRSLCHGHARDGAFDLDTAPEVLATFEKMALLDPFWRLMGQEFGYSAEAPSVAGLLRRLFVSELFHQAAGTNIAALAQHRLPPAGARNAVVFLTQWRDSSTSASSYDAAAAAVAREQRVDDALVALDLETLRHITMFWEAERRVVSALKEKVRPGLRSSEVEVLAALAKERKAGHWLAGPGSDEPERRAMSDAYDAIVAAAELLALQGERRGTMTFATPKALLAAYQQDLYRFDRLYRRFHMSARPARSLGWDLLKGLTADVERVYDQGFLQPLGLEWSRLLDDGFLSQWKAAELPAQQDFYADRIRPHLAESDRKRAYVIISDALRYEAAAELTEALNGRFGMTAELGAMLGVLPSYTALGMASLLPHRSLGYSDKGEVLVDGRPCAGTDARSKQLETVGGMACQASDLRVLTVDEARELTQGKRVVYIYHDVIDARGDTASTEGETFEAVRDCLRELADLTAICVNKLNAAKVWITADHGFIYQEEAPGSTDKSKLAYKPESAVKSKKRYVLGRSLGVAPEAHHGSTHLTAGTEDGMQFWVPRGANRFHFSGGARFVHGGAMPQEVVVPVVTVTHLRGKEGAASRVEKVSVNVLGGPHKITMTRHRFELIQTVAVSERRKPLTLRVAVYDEGQAVSSVVTVVLDSSSELLEERKKDVRVDLRAGTFDKSRPYRLVLHDKETDGEVLSLPVVIDRSIENDF